MFEAQPITVGDYVVRCGDDRDGVWIALERSRTVREVVRIPEWFSRGNLQLVASDDERFVALWFFTGEGEGGYLVFALEPELRRIGGLPEADSLGSEPVFSPGSRWLVALDVVGPTLGDDGESFEEVHDESSADRVIVDWASLHVHRLPEGTVASFGVRADIPCSADVDEVMEWQGYQAVRFVGEDEIVIAMPGGAPVRVALPPAGPILARRYG